MAHLLARLRIAAAVAHVVARLASDLLVSALIRRAFHPQDGSSEFQDIADLSFLSDQPFLVTSIAGPNHTPQFNAGLRFAMKKTAT
jgi:hypothetical protein